MGKSNDEVARAIAIRGFTETFSFLDTERDITAALDAKDADNAALRERVRELEETIATAMACLKAAPPARGTEGETR